MQRCTWQNRPHILVRPGEIVDPATGELRFVPLDEPRDIHPNPQPCVPGSIPFLSRPRSFLTELRSTRSRPDLPKPRRTRSPGGAKKQSESKTSVAIATLLQLAYGVKTLGERK